MIPLSSKQDSIARIPNKTGPEVLFASCGSNEHGQLGTGNNVSSSCFRTTDWSSLPPENSNASKVAIDETKVIGTTIAIQTQQLFRINTLSAVSCGESHTVCCWNDGVIYAWGNNNFGQLGLQKKATTNYALVPTRIPIPNLYDGIERESDNSITNSTIPLHVVSSVIVRTVSCGSFHTLVVTSTGCLLTCGKNSDGCLGLGTLEEYRSELTRVTVFVTENSEETQSPIVVGAAAGYAHSLALTQHGSVFSFGRGAEGQLGDGKFGSSTSSSYSTDVSSLVHVGGSSTMLEEDSSDTETPKSFLVGNITTASSTSDENTIASGKEQTDEYLASNDDDGGFPHRSLVPVIVSGPLANKPVAIIACSKGGHGCFAVTASDGYGWRWGLLDNRAASKKSMMKCVVPTPTPLPPPLGTSAEEVADVIISGPFDSAPGENKSNTLPSPADAERSYNVSRRKNDNRIVSISAGAHHVICVTRSGEAWAMGGPGPFLGLGPGCQVEWLLAPGRVLLPGDILINGVACGETHTLLSTACGKVFACGEPSTCLGVVDGSWKQAAESSAVVNVPKEVLLTKSSSLAVYSEPKKNKNDPKKCRNKSSSRKTAKACFIAEYSYGRDSVSSFLLNECEDDAAAKTLCFMEDQSVLESFADDEDYWGEDILGYELEMDFFSGSAPYGGGSARADIMSSTSLASFRRLTCETKRHICNSTLAVGGAIISGGQKIGGIVSAVASGLQVSSSSTTGDQTKTDTTKPQQRSKGNDPNMRGLAPAKLCRSESQQDSFDGLTGNSRRIIHMSAGRNLSIIHMADKPDC